MQIPDILALNSNVYGCFVQILGFPSSFYLILGHFLTIEKTLKLVKIVTNIIYLNFVLPLKW